MLLTYPIWNKVVQAQSIGVRVILPIALFVVDLREFESCSHKKVRYI